MNLLSVRDLPDDLLWSLLDDAARHKRTGPDTAVLAGRVAALMFYEPSTRTRLSFSAAAQQLGAGVIGFAEPTGSSASKGESLADAVRVVQAYADVLVLRHPRAEALDETAAVTDVPVVNAGNGAGEHPTQTLCDLFTIRERLGRLTGLRVGLYGDLRYGRTAHSLALALARFGTRIDWVAPDRLQPDGALVAAVDRAGARCARAEKLDEVLPDLDVLYVCRPQRERWPAGCALPVPAPVDRSTLLPGKDDLLVMHALPRTEELSTDVDDDPRAVYFEQAANGVPVRMAVLGALVGDRAPAAPRTPVGTGLPG